jgi:hypothetical protein
MNPTPINSKPFDPTVTALYGQLVFLRHNLKETQSEVDRSRLLWKFADWLSFVLRENYPGDPEIDRILSEAGFTLEELEELRKRFDAYAVTAANDREKLDLAIRKRERRAFEAEADDALFW